MQGRGISIGQGGIMSQFKVSNVCSAYYASD